MTPFSRHTEAYALIQATSDPRRKAMMQLALSTALVRVPAEDGALPFDLEHCARIAKEAHTLR